AHGGRRGRGGRGWRGDAGQPLLTGQIPQRGEVQDPVSEPRPLLQQLPPLRDLVRLRGEVEELAAGGGEIRGDLDDGPGTDVVAVAEGLVQDEREVHALLEGLDERPAHGEEELGGGGAGGRLEGVAEAGPGG